MRKVKFQEIFDFQKKSKVKAGEGLNKGIYPFFTSSNILSKFINEYSFENESLVFGTGGQASIHFCDDKFNVSTDCFVTQLKENIDCETKYIYYFLSGNIHILEREFKGAGLKHISKVAIQNIQIPLPPLPQQKHIAQVLDKADALRKKNKELLQEYNELQQSVFLDMFGDPVTNSMGWENRFLSTCYINDKEGTKCGPFGSALKKHEYTEKGIPVWVMDNIEVDGFKQNKSLFISDDKFKELKKYQTFKGDIIISRAGTVGKMCEISTEKPAIISTNLIRLRLNQDILLPLYFITLMNNWGSKVTRLKTGNDGAFTHMNTGTLNKINFPLPPIDLQNKFTTIIENIEKQKEKVKESLAYSEDLFGALVQRYFKE